MFKTRIAAIAIAAVTVVGGIAATTNQAEARRWGWGGPAVGAGIVAGALVGAAIASNAYARPRAVYVAGPRRCRVVRQYDGFGYWRPVRVCRW